MKRLATLAGSAALALVLLAGCDTALMVGDRVVGVKSGSFFYTDGMLRADYRASFEDTWLAGEQALRAVNATILERERKISSGTYQARMNGEDIRIVIEYLEPDTTRAAVRVGLTGNELASKMIHDRIMEALSNP